MLPFAVIDRIGLLQTADWTSQNFFAALGCTQLIDFADISTNRPYRYDAFCEPDELSFHIIADLLICWPENEYLICRNRSAIASKISKDLCKVPNAT